ncbi:TauD/TfdA family dioxygenase [Peribacillus simplex]|uniref:TauD/TfdA family dioxygenase n=1 Tax=Peribacillus simplex TaxID=1478 RepID=UPI0014854B82|nr:TauD/TfdA family dioxygenase [Peribacillus simplex]
MHEKLDELLRTNIFQEVKDYHYINNETNVIVIDMENLDNVTKEKVIKDYYLKGFAIVELRDGIASERNLTKMTQWLNLGAPYIPRQYDKLPTTYNSQGLNVITYSSTDSNSHRAFQTRNGQNLHSDGTLEVIGFVKTSILFCEQTAENGGETTLFNSVGAFFNVIKDYLNYANALLDEKALKRIDIGRTNQESIGPVFKILNNELVSRFSMDNTCLWEHGFKNVPFLEEAYNYITSYINLDSPFYTEFSLKEGQGIIFANDKISHGRRKYYDSKEKQRKMHRGLYTERPF